MAEAPLAVASAVILPDSAEEPISPTRSLKRRRSSIFEDSAKRPRLSQERSNGEPITVTSSQSPKQDRSSDRRRNGQMEERKRGQRLFGALLGTLSQSSSSTAQKRRTDIEKKQQAKLKLQAEEQDEKKKQKLEALMVIRREEQKKYDKQSMNIRHSNLLAQAHFLSTKTEPKLYYKPWELLPGNDEKIKTRIEEAEKTIAKEVSEWDAENEPTDQINPTDTQKDQVEKEDMDTDAMDTVGSETNQEQLPDIDTADLANSAIPDVSGEREEQAEKQPDTSKDQGDDGGEVVEGDEDTVIY